MVVGVINPPHTRALDTDMWPGVASVPDGFGMKVRSRLAEAQFARAVAAAGLHLRVDESDTTPDLVIEYPELFNRLAEGGWVGLAEGYLAGEWRTETPEDLARVLKELLSANYRPRTTRIDPNSTFVGGEIPPELVARYSGDGMSSFAGRFATGVPTTQRIKADSHVRGAGRGNEPATHFIDVTEISEPVDVERADLGDAQRRSVEAILETLSVGPGSHVLEYPSAGGAFAIAAAQQRATVDTVTSDPAVSAAISERFTFAGVSEAVHTELLDDASLNPGSWHGRYDGIASMEKLETLGHQQRAGYLSAIDRLLAPGGRVGLQSVVATDLMNQAGSASLESLRAYVWPALDYPTVEGFRQLVDKRTGLRVVGEVHAPKHLELTLRLQRKMFTGQLREAAADGFDVVYRRLWIWQLSLREALAALGMIDVVQFTLTHRHRGGRR
ncbi:SAM-dependent methyltransferase [Corynebacterium lubricantis]|uniref:SAM-dependent methyltransferase n=1 Tax=Corynebacterium lubricantis TaxID=541095 RepID=UPI000366471F|nr:class I SAM-dependent methyltransferase [Corynebacterium lubricantis]